MLPATARQAALLGLALLAVWCFGRYANDDHLLTQYLWWIPGFWACLGGWVLLVFSAACARISLRPGGVILRPFLLVGLIALTGWLVFCEARRIITAPEDVGPPETGLRVVYINLSVGYGSSGVVQSALELNPDVLIIANPRWAEDRGAILDDLDFAFNAPPEPQVVDGTEAEVARTPRPLETDHLRIAGEILIASRVPIVDVDSTSLPKLNGWLHFPLFEQSNPGTVVRLELDAGERAGVASPTVVWIADLPSNPFLYRGRIMHAAYAATEPLRASGRAAADLVIGDFNTPRNSRSLDVFVPNMDESVAESGGPGGLTWPREMPIFTIDLAFTGDRLDATRSAAIDLDAGRHKGIVVDVVPSKAAKAKPAPATPTPDATGPSSPGDR